MARQLSSAFASGALVAAFLVAPLAPGHAADPLPEPIAWQRAEAPLTLSFVGDIMHHRRNAAMPDYDRLYDSVRALLSVDDLSFANIEFPVDPSRPPDGYPIFNGSVPYVEAAIRAGFDAFALANNHTFDLGVSGVDATAAVFRDLESRTRLFTNGIRREPRAAIEPTEIYHRGWRIGFVSITAISNERGSFPYINLVSYFNDVARSDFLARVSEWSGEYDLLVVGVHAGDEYVTTPSEPKAAFLREIADAGAQIVWSHHPHVLQPWERRGAAVIIHSAGNFVSAQRRHQSPYVPAGRWAPTGDTAIYQLRVEQADGSAVVTRVRTPPFTMYDDPVHGLVLRSFDEVLAMDHDLTWRAFYLARFGIMKRTLAAPGAGGGS